MAPDTDTSRAPVALVPNKSDTEKAAEYREELIAALQPVCEIMTRARHEGINITWTVQPGALDKFFVSQLTTSKELK